MYDYTDWFFRAFSSVVRQMPGWNPQRRSTARTLPSCVALCIFCVLCNFVFFVFLLWRFLYLCVCTEQLPPGGYPIAVKCISIVLVPYVIFIRFLELGKALFGNVYYRTDNLFLACWPFLALVHSLLSFWGRVFPLAIGSAAHLRTVSPRLIVGLRALKSQRRAKEHSTHHSSWPYDLFRIPEQMTVEGSTSCQGKER
jgi:energy-coupling factor transporter transmembrane protein EcfT